MHSRNKLLAAAIGAIVAAPAAHAQSVEIYGKLYPYLITESGSNPTAAGTTVSTLAATPTGTKGVDRVYGMAAGNSNIGFRGREDLGGGMGAFFQLESQVGVDNGAGGSGSQFWSRNTYVGLDGGWGMVRLGLLDTPYKSYGDVLGILGVSSGTFMGNNKIMRQVGYGTNSASSFHLRRSNSLTYDTPVFGGVQASVQYSTNEAKTATRDPRVWSMGVKYEAGPYYAALAHEIHWDLFGGSINAPTALGGGSGAASNSQNAAVNSRDKATQLTLGYTLGTHKIHFDINNKSYNENPTVASRFQSYKNTAYMVSMDSRWGDKWRTAFNIAHANAGSCTITGAACNTDGLSGTKFLVAGAYYFSKRTYLFGAANMFKNGKSARFSALDVSGGSPAAGENTTQLALGLATSF